MNDLAMLKARYSIMRAWADLGLRGKPGRCVSSPLREDAHPSLSVWTGADGRECFKDHATGEGGDVIDFVKLALNGSTAEAIRWIEARLGLTRERPAGKAQKPGPKLPPLRRGTTDELRELADQRGFAVEALRLAEERGFLHFTALWGFPAWGLTDQRRQLHEFRRLDGAKWPAFGHLAERKAHCVGTGKAWPIGTLESRPFPKIAWVEGPPDLLAVLHFLRVENKAATVAPVGVLGASNHRLAPEALAHFAGKAVCLYPHCDEAGQKAARSWALALKEAGAARVTAFDLSGIVTTSGETGKDLADVCRIGADCFEAERKFWEVLP
jgi:hypothetical protein